MLRRTLRYIDSSAGYAHAGSVTFVQRFGDSLNVNVHFHVLAMDGVFDADEAPRMRFLALAPPDDAEILRLWSGVRFECDDGVFELVRER